jgi:hypothetical protein
MAAMTLGLKLVLEGGNLKSPWVIDTTTEDGYEFVKLSLSCRSFASLCGADMSTRAPLKNNSFLERLAELRDSDIVKLMKTANEARAVKLSRKEFVDEIDKHIVVHVPGFHSSNGFIDGAAIKVLVSSSSLASPSIEATPANFEFVRLGVRSCFDGPSPKRRRGERRSHGQFEGCPNVRWNEKRASCFVRFMNKDGRWQSKTLAPKRSDVPETVDEYIMEAARIAQLHFDNNHCAVDGDDDADDDADENADE